MVSWHVGDRTYDDAVWLLEGVQARIKSRIQLTTDGLGSHPPAVAQVFGYRCRLRAAREGLSGGCASDTPRSGAIALRFALARCAIPDRRSPRRRCHISTSYVERQNLNMRMGTRRFTRLTNAFSKKIDNHGHSLALYFLYYNFVRIHKTLKMSPAMAAGVTDKLWGS